MKEYDPKEIEKKWPASAKASGGQAEGGEYKPANIEKKWQDHWEKSEIYKASEDSSKRKFYFLV